MIAKLTYTTKLSYTHRIENEPKLIDASCKANHPHENCELKVKVLTLYPDVRNRFIDFKMIKDVTETVLLNFKDQNVTDKFNVGKSEEIVFKLIELLVEGFNQKGFSLNRGQIEIELQETPKYGIELCSQ